MDLEINDTKRVMEVSKFFETLKEKIKKNLNILGICIFVLSLIIITQHDQILAQEFRKYQEVLDQHDQNFTQYEKLLAKLDQNFTQIFAQNVKKINNLGNNDEFLWRILAKGM